MLQSPIYHGRFGISRVHDRPRIRIKESNHMSYVMSTVPNKPSSQLSPKSC